jgi:short-subunit dehydrogenase
VDLTDAVVVVTGASAGIGRATALAFAARGARVVVSARRADRLDRLVEEITNAGGTALAVRCDVTDPVEIEALARRVDEAFGRCDALINNAGIPGGGPFAQLSMEQIDRVVATNLLGVLRVTKAFLPLLRAGERAHIVNVASLAGRYAVPGASVYSATKHGVVAFSEALSLELEPYGVLVTAVNPGLVATEGFPHHDARERRLGRVMPPERVAQVIVRIVERGTTPERSIPRWLGAFQAVRVLTPRLYRFGVRRATRGSLRPAGTAPP